MGFSESDFIAWVTAGGAGGLPVGPGDDAAVLPDGQVLSVDACVEGIHFSPGTAVDLVARKALGAALSDLCAMGALAGPVLVSVQLPPGYDGEGLARALVHWARVFGVGIAGGDTVRSGGERVALVVTVTGRCPGAQGPWLRSGAREGDRLAVTGALGGAPAGRHLAVVPRFDIVRALRVAGETAVHACIDLSDGLGRDLLQLCAVSGVGALVEAERLPIHVDVDSSRDPIQAALDDGEDYELLLALPPSLPLPEGVVEVGRVQAQGPPVLRRAGRLLPWPGGGYEHVF